MVKMIPGGKNFLSTKFVKMLGKKGLICPLTENDLPVLEGIRDGVNAFSGPQVIHLDLTNLCNLNCIACWCQSPLLGRNHLETKHPGETLPFQVITSFIDDIVEMGGITEIKLGGGGEPTMHPKFADVLTYLRKRAPDIKIDINTNFTRFDDRLIDLILETGVNRLTVSLWAGTSTTYQKTHPNQQGQATFELVVSNLRKLCSARSEGLPEICIHNVLMNLNYHELEPMFNIAMDIGADNLHFVLVDPVPGKTEQLLLSNKERAQVVEQLQKIKPCMDIYDNYTHPRTSLRIQIVNYLELLRRLSQLDSDIGIYDKKAVERIPCYMGWVFTRVLADGRVAPCCKGHRMTMGNLKQNRFKEIWHSTRYKSFRRNGLKMKRSNTYYSLMGNKLQKDSGCYNCDNLMHNTFVHRKILSQGNVLRWAAFELLHWLDL